jgi:hypothetical protein
MGLGQTAVCGKCGEVYFARSRHRCSPRRAVARFCRIFWYGPEGTA